MHSVTLPQPKERSKAIYIAWLSTLPEQPDELVHSQYPTFIIWPTVRVGKMNQILRCDWLPERARWSYLARWGLPAVSRKKTFPESHIINPLLTKLVRSRWLDIGSLLFCECMDLDSVSVHKHTQKKNAANRWPHTWSITHIFFSIVFVGETRPKFFQILPCCY